MPLIAAELTPRHKATFPSLSATQAPLLGSMRTKQASTQKVYKRAETRGTNTDPGGISHEKKVKLLKN